MNVSSVSKSQEQTISNNTIKFIIKEAAERFSELRRIKNLFREHQHRLKHIKNRPSSKQEMLNDWENACIFVASKILHGDNIYFAQIDSESFPIMEEVWLKDIKLLKAYYIWEQNDAWCMDRNYFEACNNIRMLLIESKKFHRKIFEKVRIYLEKKYLTNGKINEEKSVGAKTLISRKARRIWQSTGHLNNDDNWNRAKHYVSMFYNNIIPAVMTNDEEKILNVLGAFEFSKSPNNRYLIINGFEAAIAICFLDKNILQNLSDKPEWSKVL